jgi:hypothetical protein
VVLGRDAGSYALYAQWIATRHGLPVDAHLDAFGGVAALAVPGSGSACGLNGRRPSTPARTSTA